MKWNKNEATQEKRQKFHLISSLQEYDEEKCRKERRCSVGENVSTNRPHVLTNMYIKWHLISVPSTHKWEQHVTIMIQHHRTMPGNHPPERPPARAERESLSISLRMWICTYSFCHSLPWTRIFLILYQVLPPFHFSMCMCNWRWRMVTQRKQSTLFRSASALLIGVSFAHSFSFRFYLLISFLLSFSRPTNLSESMSKGTMSARVSYIWWLYRVFW